MQFNLKLNVKKMDSDVSAMASLWKRAFCAQISKCFMFIFIGCKICCCNCIHIYIYFLNMHKVCVICFEQIVVVVNCFLNMYL